jgi:hypothetical protein
LLPVTLRGGGDTGTSRKKDEKTGGDVRDSHDVSMPRENPTVNRCQRFAFSSLQTAT